MRLAHLLGGAFVGVLTGCSQPQHFRVCDAVKGDCAKQQNNVVLAVIVNEDNKTAMVDGSDGRHVLLSRCSLVDSRHWECSTDGSSPADKITYGEDGDRFYNTDSDPSIGYYSSEVGERFSFLDEVVQGIRDESTRK